MDCKRDRRRGWRALTGSRDFRRPDAEHVVRPGGHVEVQTVRVKIALLTIETAAAQQIVKTHRAGAEILKRQPNAALAPVRGVVDSH